MNQKSDIDIEATLEKFRHWLSEARASGDGTAALEPNSNSSAHTQVREFGIIDLIEEFTALRHELKLQTKSGRTLIDRKSVV